MKTFEDYLSSEFFRTNNPTKQNYEEMFDNWLANLDGNDYIDLGDKFIKERMETINNILKKELETWAKERIGAKAVESVILAINEK